MSRLYDTMEPSVIDEDMLQKAVEEQGPKDEAGKIAKSEGIDFKDVTVLRLEFKNILEIDNLWIFTSLTKLQLDNNIIEKIKGLDDLTNLIWLDLSFNNIEMIEGMDKLTKLQDLTLYNNRISKIDNMDKLMELHVFSIGNNNLADLENVIYLRRFKNLKTLNLNGNKFCEQPEYKQYVISYLPTIDFLDYRLIDEQSEAFVDQLNGPNLFESMYADDTDGKRLTEMPVVNELVTIYREKFVGICQQIFNYGLQEFTKRHDEVKQFWECLHEAKSENKEASMKHIENFMIVKKRIIGELNHTNNKNIIEAMLKGYNQEVNELWDKLMALELQLVDQFEEIIKEFERNLQDLRATFIENVQGYLSQCRDLENMHNEKMLEISVITLEKVIKNELEEEISDDLRNLFVDKDTIVNAVTASHDVHLLKIDNKEDDIVTRINTWVKGTMEKIHTEEEIKRNRVRVSEINNLIDHMQSEVEIFETVQGS